MSTEPSQISEICLDGMERIAATAASYRSSASNPLAQQNSFTDGGALRTLEKGRQEEHRSAAALQDEPMIAWVKVMGEEGGERQFFVARHGTTSLRDATIAMTHRGAPMGRLASLPPGDGALIQGREYEVIERCILVPRRLSGQWDGIDALIEREGEAALLDIKSLRALLDLPGEVDPFAILDEVPPLSLSASRRLKSSTLRDIAILDQFQDEIYRLEPDARVLLLGPPGTGKTTTLIKRVAAHVNPYEASAVGNLARTLSDTVRPDDWLLFSPTPLLRDFAKEAFSKENLPSGNDRVVVWSNFRTALARDELRLLRRGATGSGAVLSREDAAYPSPLEQLDRLAHLEREDWSRFQTTMRQALETLLAGEPDLSSLRPTLDALGSEAGALISLTDAATEVVEWRKNGLADLNATIDRRIERLAREDRSLVPELQRLLEVALNDDDEDEDGEEVEEVVSIVARSAKERLLRRVRLAIRGRAERGPKGVTGTQARIVDRLPDEAFSREELGDIKRRSLLLKAALPLTRVVRERLTVLPRYRALRAEEGVVRSAPLTQVELDLLSALTLRMANRLVGDARILRQLDDPAWTRLRDIAGRMRNAIFVDEATDFSPLELMAMHALTNPHIGGITLAGDFDQRMDRKGIRTVEEARLAVDGIKVREIERGYRQSAMLTRFRTALLTGEISEGGSGGWSPALLEGSGDANWDEIEAHWVAKQIVAIDEICNQLPSLAVFVPNEDDIDGMTYRLGDALRDTNLEVQACRGGVLGEPERVRVFSIDRVKGLEFEAAILTGLDRIERHTPDLARQHLYVGVSRPANFLGLTSELPTQLLNSVRRLCVVGWDQQPH